MPDRPLLVGNANKQREPGLTEPLPARGGPWGLRGARSCWGHQGTGGLLWGTAGTAAAEEKVLIEV